MVYQFKQQDDLAQENFIEARRIAEHYQHLSEKAEPARHLALLALMNGKLDQALDYALEALSFREQESFMPYIPLDHLLLSDIYLKIGDTANALLCTQEAYKIAEELGVKRLLAYSLLSLGDIQATQNNLTQARSNYEKALVLVQELQLPFGIVKVKECLNHLPEE